MAAIKIWVKKTLTVQHLNFNQKQMVKLGTVAVAENKNRVGKAKNLSDAPSKPLSKGYAIRKSRNLARGGFRRTGRGSGRKNVRDLSYTGDMLQNECIYRFFTTGEFTVHIPFKLNLTHKNPFAIGALDFIGLNYYSNRHLFLTKTVQEQEPERTTDNGNYRIYPQGLYRAIVELSERIAQPLSIPIYVTENGIATMDDEKRYAFYHQYLYALCKAIEDGYPVYGYLPWTLADNYEWPNRKKHSKRVYGLCSVDKNDPAKLIIKNGTRSYIDFVNAFDT